MRKIFALTAAIALFVPAAISSAGTTVDVKDDFFSPKSVTVGKGSTVKFVFKGRAKHNVTGSGFGSKNMKSGSYSHKFNKTTKVFCTIHSGMQMTVKVK